MEDGTRYDEDLAENPFFRLLQSKQRKLLQRIEENRWIVCVPRVGSVSCEELVKDDFESHIFVTEDPIAAEDAITARTLSGKVWMSVGDTCRLADDYVGDLFRCSAHTNTPVSLSLHTHLCMWVFRLF